MRVLLGALLLPAILVQLLSGAATAWSPSITVSMMSSWINATPNPLPVSCASWPARSLQNPRAVRIPPACRAYRGEEDQVIQVAGDRLRDKLADGQPWCDVPSSGLSTRMRS